MNLAQFESSLAAVADTTLTSIAPSGGFASFLQKNPSVAALFSIAIMSAHTYLAQLEAPVAQSNVISIPVPPPPPPKPV